MPYYAPPQRAERQDTDLEDRRRNYAVNDGVAAGAKVTDYTSSLAATPVQLSSLDAALLQFRRAVSQRGTAGEVEDAQGSPHEHVVARAGVSGSASPLPFLERIQGAFGRHDISGVRAHTDRAARQANQDLGATAYATGTNIAFGNAPDLHTAAHEAAHVVQQRAGVSLPGGVGEADDRYERQADRVADAVVRGDSAEGLLDEISPQGTASHGVQFDGRQPLEDRRLQERSFEFSRDYASLADPVARWVARHVMSRTEVPQDDGEDAPIHREEGLVATSNLRTLFEQLQSCVRPGQQVTLSATLIAGTTRYESVTFESPQACQVPQLPEPAEAESPPSPSEEAAPARLATPDIAPHGQLVPTDEAATAGVVAAAAVLFMNPEIFLAAIGGLLQSAVDETWRRRMIRELQPQVEAEIERKQARIRRIAAEHPGERIMVDILVSELRMRMQGEHDDGQLMNMRFQRCSFRAASQPLQMPRPQRREVRMTGATRITIPHILHVPLNLR